MDSQTWQVDLPVETCEQLLAGVALGRLGVVVEGRPEIFPVNHVFDPLSRCVAFTTAPGTKMHAAVGWPWVAYEVDGVEEDGAAGWSVLVVGRAEEVADPTDVERLEALRRELWRPGPGARWIRVVPSKTTGRRISAVRR